MGFHCIRRGSVPGLIREVAALDHDRKNSCYACIQHPQEENTVVLLYFTFPGDGCFINLTLRAIRRQLGVLLIPSIVVG